MSQDQPDRNTPLDPDESDGLIPTHITTQGALNEWEQKNILEAEQWALTRRRTNVLSMEFLLELHRRMFDQAWNWAGTIRKTTKNIGIPVADIRPHLMDLLRDAQYWIENKTYEPDELAARFHHRLVQIHPFPHGNGRHGRLMTDIILVALGKPRFSWGGADLYRKGEAREQYLAALEEADRSNLRPLLAFVRS